VIAAEKLAASEILRLGWYVPGEHGKHDSERAYPTPPKPALHTHDKEPARDELLRGQAEHAASPANEYVLAGQREQDNVDPKPV